MSAQLENLKDGATVDGFVEWSEGVDRDQVQSILDHEMDSLGAEIGGSGPP